VLAIFRAKDKSLHAVERRKIKLFLEIIANTKNIQVKEQTPNDSGKEHCVNLLGLL
jgi:hypothetical protein